jgi:NAD(P)-dependent dehydrogenase (short-subunit alcohol dehydrogenase family)
VEANVKDILGYEGTRCVVVGAATGMGAACATALVEMGAEVIALDIAPVSLPVKQTIEVDLSNPKSIDAAVRQIGGEIPKVFVCAGVPGPPRFDALQTMTVNFVGVRQVIEALLPKVPRGGAVALIASIAGVGYAKNLPKLKELCATPTFESAVEWCKANPDVANGYLGSKQALIVYTKLRASQLVAREIRLNALLPCPTDTPMLPQFYAQAGGQENLDKFFQSPIGRAATAAEMGDPLILLNSDAARFVSGIALEVDYGYCGEVHVGVRPGLL